MVLGNPPWDQVQLDPGEFFATRDHSITAQPNMAARNRAIEQLATSNRPLHEEYQAALRSINGIQKFLHSSDRFPKSNYGRLNSAPLFAEHCLHLLSPTGRAGIIVPTSIATDSFNQYFFTDLVDKQSLVSLYDFENREGVFPGVHRSYKFCLLTLSGVGRPQSAGGVCLLPAPHGAAAGRGAALYLGTNGFCPVQPQHPHLSHISHQKGR